MKNETIIDFNDIELVDDVFYGGEAGAKDGIVYRGELWMLKYPKSTRSMNNPQISYTTSPLSEYIGSKIYASLGIPVHETLLGHRRGKIVVACKDFLYDGMTMSSRLVPFNELKNSFMASDISSYSGSGSNTLLQEVLDTISGQRVLRRLDVALPRFWDMFIIDAFIGNNDRNNGNWGILINISTGEASLAPVYDNGAAFFNKRSISQMSARMNNEKEMRDDAYGTPTCVYQYTGLDNEGHRIKPFDYIKETNNVDCKAALRRFCEAVDMNAINCIIDDIPESIGNLAIMPQIQKDFYQKMMRLRLDEVFIPTADH